MLQNLCELILHCSFVKVAQWFDDDNRGYWNICNMPFVSLSFSLAVIFIIRLFSASAFHEPMFSTHSIHFATQQTTLFSSNKEVLPKTQQCICNYTTSIFDTNVKQRQQSMKIWTMPQMSLVMSLFSEVYKPDWPRKKLVKFLRPVMNRPRDQLEQWTKAYDINFKVCSTPMNIGHAYATDKWHADRDSWGLDLTISNYIHITMHNLSHTHTKC